MTFSSFAYFKYKLTFIAEVKFMNFRRNLECQLTSNTCDLTSRKIAVDSGSEPLGCLKMYQIFVSLSQLEIIGWMSVVHKCQGQSILVDDNVITTIFKSGFADLKIVQPYFCLYFGSVAPRRTGHQIKGHKIAV